MPQFGAKWEEWGKSEPKVCVRPAPNKREFELRGGGVGEFVWENLNK